MARDGNTVLLFGPQALSLHKDWFDQLKSDILGNAESRWIINVVAQLPTYLQSFSEKSSKVEVVSAVKLLKDLNDWISTGNTPLPSSHLPNVIVSPLIVLLQLTQYSKYLELAHGEEQNIYGAHSQLTEVVGFCTGLLSALAVSSAGDRAQFQHYGAVAVRLAALIGAFVDGQDALGDHGGSKSFATVWNSNQAKTEMTRIMQQLPEVTQSSSVLDT